LGGRGRWISEFEASLVYKVSSRTARAIQRNPVLEKKKKKKDEEGNDVAEQGGRESAPGRDRWISVSSRSA
jgi:hypothetical protein